MKRTVVMFLLGMIISETIAQQDPKFSQSMFLAPMYNAGSVGISDKICLGADFRNQWMGVPKAPVSTTFSVDAPLNFLGRAHGVGITLRNDNLGFNNDFFFSLAYSYQIDLGKGKLGLGLNAGLVNQSADPTWEGADVITPEGDPSIPQAGYSAFGFDMGLGAFYQSDKLYAGLSVTHLNQTSFNIPEDNAETRLVRHYYATAGYNIQLPNPMIELMPSFLVQTDGKSNHIYLNTNVRYNKKFWGGVSYTIGGAITALVGVDLMNGAKIGYSYDFDLTKIVGYNTGSHEITVRYCFDMSFGKTPQKYKSIRIM
ncbi:MAG: type IX secretion system membrane protein PorP/SprF [Bacteroidota bacterium]